MQIYFGITGGCCLLYYLFVALYTGKWNSTFMFFWPVLGTLHLLVAIWNPGGILAKLLPAAVFLGWGLFLGVEQCIWRAMRKRAEDGIPWMVVLGAQVRGTQITSSLMRRLDEAVFYLQKNEKTNVIVSGGQGPGEDISEAEAMARYLVKRGIEECRIFKEDRSTSTWENLRNSQEYFDISAVSAVIVTNNFHLYRALKMAKRLGYQSPQGIAASANTVLLPNYLVREFFAVVWMRLVLRSLRIICRKEERKGI